ncbi:MAG TPA: PKD domain-containing protein [Candidatus Kryptonia bacterium]|nr:PKD domain-containing protein [Candidatus Kryptonia bacterium]
MRSARSSAALLLLFLVSGCNSCQKASDGDGTGEQSARPGAAAPAAGSAATSQGRIAVPTVGRPPEFAATQPPAPAEEPGEEEPTIAEPFEQGDCVVIIDADPDFGAPPLSVNFSVEAQCAGGTPTYSWDFGDNSPPSAEPAPVHVYQKAGEYTVTLKAVAANGAQASDDIAITVEESLEQ